MKLSPFDCEITSEPFDPDPYALGNTLLGRRGVKVTIRAISPTGLVQCWVFEDTRATVEQRPATSDDYQKARQVASELVAALPDDWQPTP